MPPEPIDQLLNQIRGAEPLSNTYFPFLTYIPVYKQNREDLCGYYMLHNAKVFVRALLAQEKYS